MAVFHCFWSYLLKHQLFKSVTMMADEGSRISWAIPVGMERRRKQKHGRFFLLGFWSYLLKISVEKCDCDGWHFVPASLYRWHARVAEVSNSSNLLYSLLVKSEPGFCPVELKFKAIRCFFLLLSVNTQRARWSLQMKIFEHFLRFHVCILVLVPL